MSFDESGRAILAGLASRRQFLARALQLSGGIVAAGTLLAACGGSSETPAPSGGGDGGTGSTGTASPAQETQTGGSPQSGGELIIGLVAEPVSLDGGQVTDVNSARVIRRITEQLVDFEEEKAELAPGLAENWEISADGMEYTFNLVKDVVFHDGTPFNAEAVQFSVMRQVSEDHPAFGYGTFPYRANYFGTVKDVEVIDEHTVKVHKLRPRAAFLAAMASAAAGIVSPTAVEKFKNDYGQNPVGTGPFKFVKWDTGVEVVLERNPDYWKTDVHLDRVIFKPFIEDQARLTALQTGGVNFVVDVPPDNLASLESDSNITVLKQAGIHFWYVGLNVTKEPLTNEKVRQALAYAIDKEAITRDVLKSTGEPAISMLNPGTWGFTDDIPQYPYDPEKAKELLAEAGFADGLEFELWVPESGSGMQSPVAMATVIQANWADVGVTARMQTLEWGTFLNNLRTGDHQAFCNSWMAGLPDPDMTLFPFLHSSQVAPKGPNRFFFEDPEIDKLLEDAQVETDQAKRAAIYKEVQQKVYATVPLIPIEHQVQTAAMTSNVKGFSLHPNFDLRIHGVWIE